ncbi:MAG: FtsQ-type POTRA domain-containing protein [Gloeobacterales cyanobacterium]
MISSSVASPATKAQFIARRQAIRRERQRLHFLKFWRFAVVLGLAIALVGLVRSPWGQIREVEQITVERTEALAPSQVYDQLALTFPMPIYLVEPRQLEERLQTLPLIERARLTRQLFPLGLHIEIQERIPVATAPHFGTVGVIDAEGVWISCATYPKVNRPQLKVEGYTVQRQKDWQALYPLLQKAPVPIQKIDFNDPRNLVLTTRLGTIWLGSLESQRINQQFQTLKQLVPLTQKYPPEQIQYFDLRDPTMPAFHLRPKPQTKLIESSKFQH